MSKELTVKDSLEEMPDYLKGVSQTSNFGLDQSDFKVPLVKLLQAQSPECVSGQPGAKAGEFWHTGAKKSLGTSFTFIPAHIGKKVILYEPTKSGTGGRILAYSKDSLEWDSGANSSFTVNVKGAAKPIIWKTGKDVHSSGLLGWGSSNPDDEKSAPAAMLIYSYICMLLGDDGKVLNELSPAVFGVYKTAIPSAQELNTQFLMLRGPGQKVAPPPSVIVKASVKHKSKDGINWTIPVFQPVGRVKDAAIYKDACQLGEQYATYQADFTEVVQESGPVVDDKIPF